MCVRVVQVSVQPLSEVAELWDRVQAALVALKHDCGLAPISNIKQTIRALLTRTLNSADSEETNLRITLKDDVNDTFFTISKFTTFCYPVQLF